MTEAQCRHVQAPILEAILPKLHLNRHTPRAVLFAGPRYGGLGIPETYTDLGYGHLQYLVGHLKLGDDIGKLLTSIITHTQLQVGSTTPFFQLPYPNYAKWIDHTWMTDCWKFSHRAKIEVDVESHWVPQLLRQGDIGLMDMAMTFHLDPQQLRCINTCRLYLQVITVSDITTARGDRLLSSVMVGDRDPARSSNLLWPTVPRPPNSFWHAWRLFLEFFARGRKLMTSLGNWTNFPPCQWKWYQDKDYVVWEKLDDSTWKRYQALPNEHRATRHTQPRYHLGEPAEPPPQCQLYPATVETTSNPAFTVSVSLTRFTKAEPPSPPDLWQHTSVPPPFTDTPVFFQHLISTPPTEQECHDIAQEITDKTLIACSDGACDTSLAVASYGTVFASNLLRQQLAAIVGPVDGHPNLLTSYRAELSGIIATLYIVYRICQHYNIEEGSMILYCDNKGALGKAFKDIKPGITPYFTTDHDLIELARALITITPVIIGSSWVKGHYTGKERQYQHDLNDTADRIAGDYQNLQVPHHTIRKPLPPPNYRIRLLHDSSVLTAKVHSTLVTQLHEDNLITHLMRKANWTRSTLNKIHWDAHERAFKRLPRYSQHSTAKMIHGLLNTNRQNHIYYGQSPLCPICQLEEETIQHVYTCSHPAAAQFRQNSLEELQQNLRNISTPSPVIEAILHGFTEWEQDPTSHDIRALTAGSLRGPDAVLTSAFHEQLRDIGWLQFCMGRVSLKWASAVTQYTEKPYEGIGEQWAAALIAALWRYSRSLWQHRNGVVHGASIEEQAQRRLSLLRSQITQHYANFEANPNIVLARHRTLFTSKTMEERLRASYDVIAAWLRSVDEALQVVQHQESQLRATSLNFFGNPPDQDVTDTDSSYSLHTTPTDTTVLSVDPTVASTVSYSTMLSDTSSDGGFPCLQYDSDDDSVNSVFTDCSNLSESSPASGAISVVTSLTATRSLAECSVDRLSTQSVDSNFPWDVH